MEQIKEDRVQALLCLPNLGKKDEFSIDYARGEAGAMQYVSQLPEAQIQEIEDMLGKEEDDE